MNSEAACFGGQDVYWAFFFQKSNEKQNGGKLAELEDAVVVSDALIGAPCDVTRKWLGLKSVIERRLKT